MKLARLVTCILFMLLAVSAELYAQPGCPFVDAGNDLSVNCNVNCVDLTADFLQTGATTSYTVESVPYAPPVPLTGGTALFIGNDDTWGDVIDLPFNFCFYGNMFNQVVVGANGLISFNTALANQGCNWSFTESIPHPNLYGNSIMGAYHDIDPSAGGTLVTIFPPTFTYPADINYYVTGTAPCRMFAVSFANVPHYNCTSLRTYQQIVIYETTNIVEVYIQDKPTCGGWNGGRAVIGLMNADASAGITPPGRNTGNWTASNEGWRFLPAGTPNYTINWYEGSNVIGNTASINVCPSATTTYTAEVIYNACDGNVVTVTDQVTVTQNSSMTTTVTPANSTLCAGQSVQLTASSSSPNVTYTWSPATGLSATTGATVTASPVADITYTVTADDGSCASSANAVITIGNMSVSATHTDVGCGDDNGTATAEPTGGTAPYTYSWNSTPVQTTQIATGLAPGDYEVTVTDNSGCTGTATVTIGTGNNSISAPDITTTDAVCSADNGTATATPVDGTAPYTYSWNTTPVQTTQTATGLTAGTYQVTLTDAVGCSVTADAVVGLDAQGITVNVTASTDISCAGLCDGSATAEALGGTLPYLFLWDDPDNQSTAVATGLCAGTFNIGVADANGCVASASVNLSEPDGAQATATMTVPSDCGQPTGAATVTATGGQVSTDYQYSWNTTPVQTTQAATGLTAGDYEVTVTDDNGCSTTASVTITSTPGFTVSAAGIDALCFGSCDGSATATPDADAVAPLAYSWSTTPAQTSITATSLCAGIYTVTATDDRGCVATADVTIGTPTKLSVTASTDMPVICIDGMANLDAEASGGTGQIADYQWSSQPSDATLTPNVQQPSVSPGQNTVYSVTATDANGCTSDPATVSIELREPLSLQVVRPLAGPDTSICLGSSATFALTAQGGDGNYTFHDGNVPNPIQLPLTVQPSVTTTYTFSVTDGCTTPAATTDATVTVNPIPTVLFTVDDPDGCDQHTALFTDQSTPSAQQWLWDFGDPQSTSNTATQQMAHHTFSGPGIYDISLQVTSAQGCSNDTTIAQMVEVFALPQASFTPDPTVTNLVGATIHFADGSWGNIATWDYSFGDGEVSSLQNPVHTYQDTGVFNITLIVTTTDGCTDLVREIVEIRPDFMFYIPNAFTPNSDGRNDGFRPYGEGVDWNSYSMQIFNRWGQMIFESGSVDNAWDGTYKGSPVEVGVYVYHIAILDTENESHVYDGRVNLIR